MLREGAAFLFLGVKALPLPAGAVVAALPCPEILSVIVPLVGSAVIRQTLKVHPRSSSQSISPAHRLSGGNLGHHPLRSGAEVKWEPLLELHCARGSRVPAVIPAARPALSGAGSSPVVLQLSVHTTRVTPGT